MNIDDFLDLLFPGDNLLNIPSFRNSDDESSVNDFLCSVPQSFIEELKNMDYVKKTPDEILKELKNRDLDLKPVINNALYFYFSRPTVVIPLSGRSLPLSKSGMAYY